MTLKAGQQVCLQFDNQVTGTVSMVLHGRVQVTWNHPHRDAPRARHWYPGDVAARILVLPR